MVRANEMSAESSSDRVLPATSHERTYVSSTIEFDRSLVYVAWFRGLTAPRRIKTIAKAISGYDFFVACTEGEQNQERQHGFSSETGILCWPSKHVTRVQLYEWWKSSFNIFIEHFPVKNAGPTIVFTILWSFRNFLSERWFCNQIVLEIGIECNFLCKVSCQRLGGDLQSSVFKIDFFQFINV